MTELLSAYIDHALDVREMRRVDSHLDGCDVCRAEYHQLLATKQLLAGLPAVAPPRSFTLTPQMVAPERQPSFLKQLLSGRLYPTLATGSVVAFVLLLLMLVGDISGSLAGHQAAPLSSDFERTGGPPVVRNFDATPVPDKQSAPTGGDSGAPTSGQRTSGDAQTETETAQSAQPQLPSEATSGSTPLAGPWAGITANEPVETPAISLSAPMTEDEFLRTVPPEPPADDAAARNVLKVMLALAGIILGMSALAARRRGL